MDAIPLLTYADGPAGTRWSLSNPPTSAFQFGDPNDPLEAWGCLAITANDCLVVNGGGHNNYSGNEVRECDLLSETPAWVITDPGSPAAQHIQGAHYYGDGKPASFHSYHNLWFNDIRQEMWMHGPTAGYSLTSPPNFSFVDRYSFVTKSYMPSTDSFAASNSAGYLPKAKDPATQDIYWIIPSGSRPLMVTRSSTLATSTVGNTNLVQVAYASMLWDPVRNRIFLGSGTVDGPQGYKIVNPTTGAVTPFNITGYTTFSDTQNQWVYDPIGDKYAMITNSGFEYVEIDPVTAVCTKLTIAGTPPPAFTSDNPAMVGRAVWCQKLRGIVAAPWASRPLLCIKRYA
jgi:hypothetical protein